MFIHFRSFYCYLIILITIKYLYFISKYPHTVWSHSYYMKNTLISNSALCNTCHKISITVIIPEWTRVNPACTWSYINRLAPFTKRIFGCCHIYSLIWHWKTYIICTLVVSYRWCPHTTSVQRIVISEFRNVFQAIINNLPIH